MVFVVVAFAEVSQFLTPCSVVRKLIVDVCFGREADGDLDKIFESGQIDEYVYGRKLTSPAPRALERLVEICRQAYVPKSYTSIICQLILARIDEGTGWMRNSSTGTVSRFLLRVFLRCTSIYGMTIVALDNISYMDELSWKLVELIYDHSPRTIILGTSRPITSQQTNIDGDFWVRLNKCEYSERFLHVGLLPMHKSDVKSLIANKLGVEISQVDSEMATEVFVKSGGMPWLALELSPKDSWNIEKSEKSDIPALKSENDDRSADNIGNIILCANFLECGGSFY
jgi:hypothetical protein